MPSRRQLCHFVVPFMIAYGLMIAPWPGWNKCYGDYFQSFGNCFLSEQNEVRTLRFQAGDEGRLDTKIVIIAANSLDASGNLHAQILALDSRSVGWIPTALLLALVLGTPLRIKRRLLALIVGLIAVHGYILFTLWIYIVNESSHANASGPQDAFAFLAAIGDVLETTLVSQLGASIIAPVIIWFLVSFRKKDLAPFFNAFAVSQNPPSRR